MASLTMTPRNDVVLVLSLQEAQALLACADEGAAGLLNDPAAAKAYIGSKQRQEAAQRAIAALCVIGNRPLRSPPADSDH